MPVLLKRAASCGSIDTPANANEKFKVDFGESPTDSRAMDLHVVQHAGKPSREMRQRLGLLPELTSAQRPAKGSLFEFPSVINRPCGGRASRDGSPVPTAGLTSADNRIDWKMAQTWIDKQPQELQALARKIVMNTTRISAAHFERNFLSNIEELKVRVVTDRPLLAIIPRDGETDKKYSELLDEEQCNLMYPPKSNVWLTDRVAVQAKGLISEVLVTEDQTESERNIWTRYKGKKVDICYIDDVSYTGSQVVEKIEDAFGYYDKKPAWQGLNVQNIYVILGACTKAAQSRIETMTNPAFRYKRYVYPVFPKVLGSPILFNTFRDLHNQGIFTEHELDQIERLGNFPGRGHDRYSRMTLTYFEHTTPDSLSTLSAIRNFVHPTRSPNKTRAFIEYHQKHGLPSLPPNRVEEQETVSTSEP